MTRSQSPPTSPSLDDPDDEGKMIALSHRRSRRPIEDTAERLRPVVNTVIGIQERQKQMEMQANAMVGEL